MKNSKKNIKKVGIVSHGCAKNLVDSELMCGMLIEEGFSVTLNDEEADLVIINTCSFIHDAEKESVQSVLKSVTEGKKVIITGCLPQKHKKELQEAIPEAVGFLGTTDFSKIVTAVKSAFKGETVFDVAENPCYTYPEATARQQITMGASSYIKIADGCNFECGYCIIPKLRGKYHSRRIEDIVKEAEGLVKKGVNEIVLIAQDTTSYGVDIYEKPSLAKLLKELNKIKELSWIRVMYAYPTMFTDELIDAFKTCGKVVKYIDLPLQHSSKTVLKAMKRPALDYEKLIAKLRKEIPEITIRTTFIVGYPGETEEDFEHLYNFTEKMKFDKMGVFEYSKEKNTYSYSLKDHVSAKIKKQRKNKLMKLQKEISKSKNQSLIGKTLPCIIEAITDDFTIARSVFDAPEIDGLVYIKTDKNLTPSEIEVVTIEKADAYDLWGKV